MKKRKLVQSQSGTCGAILSFVVFLALFLAPWHAAMADTNVSGHINSDTTWYSAESPYIVTSSVTVDQGATLTIQPGVEVKFDPDTNLKIGYLFSSSGDNNAGRLVADGTEGNEILFTANDSKNPWSGIYFSNFATNDSSLTYAVIENGGSRGELVDVNGSNPTIQNCTIRNSAGNGLRLYGDARPALASNTYENNDGYPITVNSAHSISAVDDTSVFTGNTDNRIRYTGIYITENVRIVNPGIPYLVAAIVRVYNNAVLTIDPGVELQFNPDTSLNIGYLYSSSGDNNAGRLVADGTEGSEILFTANDSASPWSGIDFSNFATNDSSLTYAVIENGGSRGELVDVNGSNPTIQNCTIRNSAGNGLRLYGDARPALASNTYENNDGYPITVNSAHSIAAVDDTSVFTGNTDNRIRYTGIYITENIWIVDPGIPYFVDISVSLSVYDNAVLTIDPGVELQFNPDTNLNIGHITTGRLVANGTEGNEILFTANDSESPWSGIDFTRFVTNDSSLTYAVIENGGSSGYLVSINGNNPTIQNCTIRNSAGDGLKLYKARPVLASNTYENNDGYPINVAYVHSISAVDDTSVFTGNTDNRIQYAGGDITEDTSVANPGIPYCVDGTVRVYGESVLTIDPGVVLQFGPNTDLQIGWGSMGTLTAQGTDDANIIFTSSQEASPAPGDWSGIRFAGVAGYGSIIEHAVVEYGGSSVNSNYGNIRIDYSSPTIESCAIRHSITNGIKVTGSPATPNLFCNTITANDVGIHIYNNANPQIHDNDIRGNTTYGIQNDNFSVEVIAENNYWGTADGPSGAGPGSGDAVSTNVDYDPFLTASAPCTLPLNASFAAEPTGGCQNLSVSFTDGSTGAITAREWDFDGDGNTDSTDRNPVYTYTDLDTYTATLTVYEGVESDTATQDIEVTESLPTADFEGGPLLSGTPPLTVNFTDLSASCGTDLITNRGWDFDNDGTIDSDQQNPSHIFYDSGYYTVKLTVTDEDGDQDTETKEDYIYVSDEAPVADPDGPYTGTEGTPIHFNGSGSYDPNGGSLTYEWDFNNDGVTDSTVENPRHTYSQDSEEQTNGVYTVTLTVYDEAGLSGTNTTTAQVADIDPAANFSADETNGTMPMTVQFTDLTSTYDGIVSWTWGFGDTQGSSEPDTEHTYTEAGTYTVTLTVVEEDGDNSTKEKVEYITVGECTTYYRDEDQDGFGTNDSQCLAAPQSPYTATVPGDCDDSNSNINPDADEVCDSVDNDCDGEIDEGVKTTFYQDSDNDGYGNPAVAVEACFAPAGYVANNTDCDDTRNDVNPGAEELCDEVDNDCDDEVDEGCGGCTINEILGDLDGDCDVDGDDRNILRASLRKCVGDLGYNADADYDGDGCITFGDYRIWYSHYKAANQP